MIKLLITTLLLGIVCLVAAPRPVAAFDIYKGVGCPKATDSAVCTDKYKGNTISGKNGIIVKITNIVAIIGGMAAIIMIIISAIKFATSGSDISTGSRTDTDVEDARHTLANALVGLAIIVLARTIIIYVINNINF